MDKNSATATALALTEKKLEVDEHLWDDDDEEERPVQRRRVRGGRGERKMKLVLEEKEGRPAENLGDEDGKRQRRRRGRPARQFKLEDFEASWDDEPSAAQEPKQPVVNESKTELESEKPDKEAAESVEVIKESVEEATEPVVKPIEETKEPVEVVAKP